MGARTCHDVRVPEAFPEGDQALLMAEGDRLAAYLAQRFPATVEQQARLLFIGRTLAVNLARVFMATVEDVTRKVGRPLSATLLPDARGRPVIVVVTPDGEVRERIPVDDLLDKAFFLRGRLRPQVEEHILEAGLARNEHLATRALVACLRAKPVLDVPRPYLTRYTKLRR